MTLSKLRTFIYCSLIAMHLMTIAHAQERAAGGTTETQMTWSALKNLVDSARSESKGAHDRLDQMLVCNKQQMIYAPGVKGATTDGCISNTDLNNVITCGDSGFVYDKSAKKCVDPSAETIACGKNKQFYNGTSCVGSAVPSCSISYKTASNGFPTHSGCQGGQPCPDGYTTQPGGGGGSGDMTGGSCGSKMCAKITCK